MIVSNFNICEEYDDDMVLSSANVKLVGSGLVLRDEKLVEYVKFLLGSCLRFEGVRVDCKNRKEAVSFGKRLSVLKDVVVDVKFNYVLVRELR